MKSAFLTDEDYRKIVLKRLTCLQYYGDSDYSSVLSGGNDSSLAWSAVPTDPDSAPVLSVAASTEQFPSQILDDPSSIAVTTTSNPSLTQPVSNLALTGGAALNTMSANPTVYSSGSQSTVSEISSVATSIGQWGYSIASMLGVGSPLPSSTTIVGSTAPPPNNNLKLLLVGVVVIAVVILIMDAE